MHRLLAQVLKANVSYRVIHIMVSASCNLHIIKIKRITIGENRKIQAKKNNGNLEFIKQDKKTSKLAVFTLSRFVSFVYCIWLCI